MHKFYSTYNYGHTFASSVGEAGVVTNWYMEGIVTVKHQKMTTISMTTITQFLLGNPSIWPCAADWHLAVGKVNWDRITLSICSMHKDES